MKTKFICQRPINEIVVLADGRVTTCCLDPRGANTFANIYQDNFEGTLKKFQHLKKRMAENKHFPVCENCVQTRTNYYNEFHKLNPSAQEIESFLATDAVFRQLIIELTVACNMSCTACLTGTKQVKKYRNLGNDPFMDTKVLKKWLSPYIDWVHAIKLFYYGETFLHPEAIEFCDFLTTSNPRIRLTIATNILPLDNDQKIKNLIKTQPNALFVSLHGAKQDSVSKYMGPNADFRKALHIMKKVVALRSEMGYKLPLVVWKYIGGDCFRYLKEED
jgi:protein-arginine kinase activator protein McsA